jgi:hypothetical protein
VNSSITKKSLSSLNSLCNLHLSLNRYPSFSLIFLRAGTYLLLFSLHMAAVQHARPSYKNRALSPPSSSSCLHWFLLLIIPWLISNQLELLQLYQQEQTGSSIINSRRLVPHLSNAGRACEAHARAPSLRRWTQKITCLSAGTAARTVSGQKHRSRQPA